MTFNQQYAIGNRPTPDYFVLAQVKTSTAISATQRLAVLSTDMFALAPTWRGTACVGDKQCDDFIKELDPGARHLLLTRAMLANPNVGDH